MMHIKRFHSRAWQSALTVAAFLFAVGQAHALTFSFSDIPVANRVGTGSNQSGVLIDFNDGGATERHRFAYNWNGTLGDVTGAEMLDALAAGLPDLSVSLASGSIASDAFVGTINYDTQSQTNGDFVTNFDFWGYFVAGGWAGDSNGSSPGGTPTAIPGAGNTIPAVLDNAPTGPSAVSFGTSGRFIEDGSWDVWSFGPSQSSYVVPEPSLFALFFGLAAMGIVCCRR